MALNTDKQVVVFFTIAVSFLGVGVLGVSTRLLLDQAAIFLNYSTVGYLLLGVGLLMIIIGLIGCSGVLLENQCLLGTFFVTTGIIAVAVIAGGVWMNQNRTDVNKMVQGIVRRDYGKDEVMTKAFDVIQQALKCCGLDSYDSWAYSAFNNFDPKMPLGNINRTVVFQIPKSCCSDPDADTCEASYGITSAPWTVYKDGCAPKMETRMDKHLSDSFWLGLAIILFAFIGIGLSVKLCCAIRNTI